jgi:hypothetical protein
VTAQAEAGWLVKTKVEVRQDERGRRSSREQRPEGPLPGILDAAGMLELQRSVGNKAATALVQEAMAVAGSPLRTAPTRLGDVSRIQRGSAANLGARRPSSRSVARQPDREPIAAGGGSSGGRPPIATSKRTPIATGGGSSGGHTPVAAGPSHKPGFGHEPSWNAMRVTIVGHASPRWRAAPKPADADRFNRELSVKRADAVKAAVTRRMLVLNPDVPITFDTEHADDEPPRDLEIGSYGEGSRTTIKEVRGDRGRDDPASRRVEVRVELLKTRQIDVGSTRQGAKHTGRDRKWIFRVTFLGMYGIFAAGGYMTFEIENVYSHQVATGHVVLYGFGAGHEAKKAKGEKEHHLEVSGPKKPKPGDVPKPGTRAKPVGEGILDTEDTVFFRNFDGTAIRLEQFEVQVLVGVSHLQVSLPAFGNTPIKLEGKIKGGLGLEAGGYVVGGNIELDKPYPKDEWEEEGQEEHRMVEVHDPAKAGSLILHFATEKADINKTDAKSLDEFISGWSERFGSP